MFDLKIRKIGNSLGTLLPRASLEHLRAEDGDVLVAYRSADGLTVSDVKSCQTLGKGEKAADFRYSGSTIHGVVLQHEDKASIPGPLFTEALHSFAGTEVEGGFDMVSPAPTGFGSWLRDVSRRFGPQLSPRHASFMSAILVAERGVRHRHKGRAVYLEFPPRH